MSLSNGRLLLSCDLKCLSRPYLPSCLIGPREGGEFVSEQIEILTRQALKIICGTIVSFDEQIRTKKALKP